MNVSVDLRIEHATGEQGRTIYEPMEAFWPDARNDQALPDYLRDYGQIWTSTPKVLVSRTRRNAEHNTRIIADGRSISTTSRSNSTCSSRCRSTTA